MKYYVVTRNGFFGSSQFDSVEGITTNKEDAYKIKGEIMKELEDVHNKYNHLSEIAQQYSDKILENENYEEELTDEEHEKYSDILFDLYQMEDDLNTHICIATYEVSDSGNAINKYEEFFWVGD